jgi:hypothetical protein
VRIPYASVYTLLRWLRLRKLSGKWWRWSILHSWPENDPVFWRQLRRD